MRRTVAITSCLAVLCLAALAVWVYMKYSGQRGGPVTQGSGSDSQTNNRPPAPTAKAATVPSVFELPMGMVFFGDGQFSPCYVDLPNKVLYRWKQVILRKDQLPAAYKGTISRLNMLDAKDFPEVVTVEALVKYREVNGEYRPGYLFRPAQVFFEWKGIVLSRDKVIPRSQDGQNAVVELDAVSQVIDMDMPAHLKDQPGLWRRP